MNVYVILTIAVFSFSLGFYTEHKFYQASIEKQAIAETEKAQLGESKIIEQHQKLEKVYVKSPCSSTPIPKSVLGLLK